MSLEEAWTKDVVCSGFRRTGLWPLDPSAISSDFLVADADERMTNEILRSGTMGDVAPGPSAAVPTEEATSNVDVAVGHTNADVVPGPSDRVNIANSKCLGV